MRPIIPPPVIALACGAGMYVLAERFNVAPFDFRGRALAAAAIALVGLAIDAVSIAAFFKAKTTVNPLAPSRAEKLVVRGLYKVSRNPMYLGMLLVLAGAFIYLAEGLNAAFLVFFVFVITEMQIKPEERALEENFGDAYRDYKKRVRRWI